MTILQTDEFVINESASTLKAKYPELVGSPKIIMLQTEDDSYYLNIGCNPMTEELFIRISDSSDNVVQWNTCLTSYPRNLLTAKEFIGYGLYYRFGKFYFVMLGNEYDIKAKSAEELIAEWRSAVL